MNVPYALVALGAFAWFLGGLYYEASVLDPFMIGLLLIALGFLAAALLVERSRGIAVASIALAFVGMLLFLGDNLLSLEDLGLVGSHLFTLGLLVIAIAFLVRSDARASLLRLGLAVGALACVVWIVADVNMAAWQPGNAIALVGLAWAARRPALPP
ncbi:MAG TPA: hypothetical protein VFH78_14410 [Candidatus Thermoplasmatota archaeon]|nr:hypothetical protein [Candidatus Thermoplasmatota archaeon]